MHDIQDHHNDDEQLPKMDELMSKMMHLSAHIKNKSESTSSTEGTSAKHKLSLKKVARKKQKSQKHQRGKKRSSKHINDFEFDSSSFTDCTDEEVLKDYIENLTANCSDSDAENSLFKKSAFLAKRDLASIQHFCIPFHGNKTESYNDSMCFPPSRKKRKKYKRHYIDGTYKLLNGQMTRKQRDKIHNVISNQYKRTSSCAFNGSCRKKYELEEYSHEEEMDLESDKSFNISNKKLLKQEDRETKKKVIDESMELPDSENSDSSVGSPCLEADDEGEETCHEVTIIPWWEKNTENSDNDMMDLTQNISKGDMASRLQKIGPLKVVSESGGFIAYANHKMKSFVHQRDITELSIFTTNKKEEKQVILLASLYNLQTSAENFGRCNKVVFTKTLTTKDADQSALKSFLSREVKLRCRKNRSSFQQTSKRHKLSSESVVKHENDCTDIIDIPIPECNMGNKMLQTMGWSPGQGLGKKSDGIINPVKAIKRPRNLGFGHPYS